MPRLVRFYKGSQEYLLPGVLELVCVSCPKEKPIYDTLIDTLSSPKAA